MMALGASSSQAHPRAPWRCLLVQQHSRQLRRSVQAQTVGASVSDPVLTHHEALARGTLKVG